MCEVFIDSDEDYNPNCPYALFKTTLNGVKLYQCTT